MNSKYNKRSNASGFTMIELLIVMVILGLLASLVAPSMFSKVDSSKIKAAEAQMQMLSTALDTFRLDVGDYPDSLDELRASSKRGWDGPYLPKDLPADPWSSDYFYQRSGSNYSLMSFGKDGKQGGDEDNADIVYR